MNKLLVTLFLVSQSLCVMASEQSSCQAAAGTLLTGTVVSAPKFAAATQTLKGVGLSHTHVQVRVDQDGQTYDVAMDNVYAVDYVKNAKSIPKSLAAIKVNDRLEMCGEPYTSGVGIHWVHSNCNAVPKTTAPDGWVKTIAASGALGSNLERSQTYCYLWN
ncbi:hypothetical protein ACO0K9_00200 [Undibacterium sp. Ji50W]|uniref:hypothetical protein n=1 Tax=Undibacterium sp. Ji50W TaxID=3413041 RepID=UPI003BF2A10D